MPQYKRLAMISISGDPEFNVGYIDLRAGLDEGVARTLEVKGEDILLDFDLDGQLVGIELLSLERLMPLNLSGPERTKLTVREHAQVKKAAGVLGRRGGLVGGLTTGAAKVRGDAEYYRRIAAKGRENRKRKAGK